MKALVILIIFSQKLCFFAAAPLYKLSCNNKVHKNNEVPVDASSTVPILFNCEADSPSATMLWYIDGQPLNSYEVFVLGITPNGPFASNVSRIATLVITPASIPLVNRMNVSCGWHAAGLSSEDVTVVWLRKPPSMPEGYPMMTELTPHMLQCSWNEFPDDFVDYYIVTIENITSIFKFNTTELKSNVTVVCDVVYKCSVMPVNIAGKGNISSVQHNAVCPVKVTETSSSINTMPYLAPSASILQGQWAASSSPANIVPMSQEGLRFVPLVTVATFLAVAFICTGGIIACLIRNILHKLNSNNSNPPAKDVIAVHHCPAYETVSRKTASEILVELKTQRNNNIYETVAF